MSPNMESCELSPSYGWQMGATSSCLNDIANDDFLPILHIEPLLDGMNMSESTNYSRQLISSNTLTVPSIHISESGNSNSNILDIFDNNIETIESTREIKSSGSEISISFFLDREPMSDVFDENNFANVNSDISHESMF